MPQLRPDTYRQVKYSSLRSLFLSPSKSTMFCRVLQESVSHSCGSFWWLMTLFSADPQHKCGCWTMEPLRPCGDPKSEDEVAQWNWFKSTCLAAAHNPTIEFSRCPALVTHWWAVNYRTYFHTQKSVRWPKPSQSLFASQGKWQMGPNEFWKPPAPLFLQ